MPAIQLDGTQLHYEERGEGDPVVLVHGSLGDHRSWEFQMQPFGERYRTVAYSRRYHHPNRCDGDESGYSASLHADDLAALMAGLGMDSAHVVGNSYGAYTALLLAARHPQRVRSVVLGEPPALPLLEDHPEGRPLRDDFLERVWGPTGDLLRQGALEDGIRTFVDGLFGEGAYDSLPAEVHALITDNACEFVAETSSPEFWTPFTCADARRIEAPALLLAGGRSLRMFELIVRELERCMPNSELVTIGHSSHDLPADDAGTYNEIVLGFLAKHAG